MAKTIEQLKAQSAEVRNASVIGENTATRVGSLFNDIVEHVEAFEAGQAQKDTEQSTSINAETARATAAETTLSGRINQEVTDRKAMDETIGIQLSNEIERAKGMELGISTKLNDEIDRAQAAEEANAQAIEAEAEARDLAINNETQARTQNDQLLSQAIAAEQERAEAAVTKNEEQDQKLSELSSLFVAKIGKNLLNINGEDVVPNKILDIDGNPTTNNASYDTSGFIEVEPNKAYTYSQFRNSKYSLSVRAYIWYDTNKRKVDGVVAETNTPITSPSNAKYLRITYGNASYGTSECMVEQSGVRTEYEPYTKKTTLADGIVDVVPVSDENGSTNVFDKSITKYDGMMYDDTTKELKSNSAFFVTPKYDISSYDRIAIYNEQGASWPRNTLFYDENGMCIVIYSRTINDYPSTTFGITRFVNDKYVYINIIDVVQSAKYVAFTFDLTSKDSVCIFRVNGKNFFPFVESYIPYMKRTIIDNKILKETEYIHSFLNEKKIVTLGDSITAGYSLTSREMPWSKQIAALFNAQFVNYGIGGSEIAVFDGESTTYNPMVLRYSTMDDDADLVIVAGGTNDWGHEHTNLGTFEDRGVDTFYGAMHTICDGLMKKYCGKDIIFMTPIKRNLNGMKYYEHNNLGYTLTQFCNAIKEVCAYYGIPVLDMYEKCPINPIVDGYMDKYIPDGTHPNFNGHRLMARYVAGFIRSLVEDCR